MPYCRNGGAYSEGYRLAGLVKGGEKMEDAKDLVAFSCVLGSIAAWSFWYYTPLLGLIVWIFSLVLILYGCYYWVRWKNRHWAFTLWGLLSPIGLLGISLLKRKVS